MTNPERPDASPTAHTTILRWVDPSNAAALDYDDLAEGERGAWVVETGGGEWVANLSSHIRREDLDEAKAEAAGELDPATVEWAELPADYGPAWTLTGHLR